MMNELSRITKIDYSLQGEPLISDIKNLQEKGDYIHQGLPLSFNYNGHWIVSHPCDNCNEKINIQELPTKNFEPINRLYTKHYSKEILDTIAKLFPTTKVFKSSNSNHFFLTNSEFKGNIVSDLFIPQKTFAYYSCPNCMHEYLCLYRQGYPIAPDRGTPEGRLGIIYIDEIVRFETQGDRNFLDLLKNHRKG